MLIDDTKIENLDVFESIINNKKIYLFSDYKENINYSVITDGIMEYIDTWVDKKPYQLDQFLKSAAKVKRYEFIINNANIIIVNKQFNSQKFKNLYINKEIFLRRKIVSGYELAINNDDKIIIKKMENIYGY